MNATMTGAGWLVSPILDGVEVETYTGVTDGNGEVAITFAQAFASVPHVAPVVAPDADSTVCLRLKSVTTTGCVIAAWRQASAVVALVSVLIPSSANASSVNVRVLVAGVRA